MLFAVSMPAALRAWREIMQNEKALYSKGYLVALLPEGQSAARVGAFRKVDETVSGA